MDARRRALLSDRLARLEVAATWIAQHGLGPDVAARRGEVWALTHRVEQWARRAEDLLAAAEAERQTASVPTLEQVTAEILAGEHDDGGAAA